MNDTRITPEAIELAKKMGMFIPDNITWFDICWYFRTKHLIDLTVMPSGYFSDKYFYEIYDRQKRTKIISDNEYNTWEESWNECVKGLYESYFKS